MRYKHNRRWDSCLLFKKGRAASAQTTNIAPWSCCRTQSGEMNGASIGSDSFSQCRSDCRYQGVLDNATYYRLTVQRVVFDSVRIFLPRKISAIEINGGQSLNLWTKNWTTQRGEGVTMDNLVSSDRAHVILLTIWALIVCRKAKRWHKSERHNQWNRPAYMDKVAS